jgi:hypothetical protein
MNSGACFGAFPSQMDQHASQLKWKSIKAAVNDESQNG